VNFNAIITKRQSVRKYSEIDVNRDVLERCMEAVRLAPSASNSQPWRFIIADEEPVRTLLAEATFSNIVAFNRFTLGSKALVAVVIDKPKLITRVAMTLKKRDWQLIDIGIAAEHFCLQAAEEGLGTCMLGWFDEKKVKKILNIPEEKTVGLMISIGYAPEDYPLRAKIRRPLKEILGFNTY
jgi:nitroreductase